MQEIPDVTAKDLRKYRELLDYFNKKIVEALSR